MSERLLRTFISVTLPKKIVSVSNMLKTTVSSKKDNIKWVNPGNIHLTLKFLGHTPLEAADEINKVLKDLVTRHSGMELLINGTGCFPIIERPRVLWLGVEGNISPLQNFVGDINKGLEKLGFPLDENDYIPHITLARVKYPPKDTPDITNFINTSYEPLKFNINRIRFMSSELFPNGPIYSILGTHFLGKNPK
ncbi:MAG: RNA 2',3'-cyclic phosphodiesterase [Planctomycetia bacterium]|nr:RNA 2',3'-cyclic phosphodiesterase [Planctomycetia bacterium]